MRDALPRQPFLLHLLPPPRAAGGCEGGVRDSRCGIRDLEGGGRGSGCGSRSPGRSRWSRNAPAGSRRTAQPGGRRAEGTALFSSGNPGAESCTAFIFSWKADACGVGMRERGKIPHVHPCSVFHFKRSGSSRSSDPGQAGLSAGDGSHQSIFPQRLLPPAGRREAPSVLGILRGKIFPGFLLGRVNEILEICGGSLRLMALIPRPSWE